METVAMVLGSLALVLAFLFGALRLLGEVVASMDERRRLIGKVRKERRVRECNEHADRWSSAGQAARAVHWHWAHARCESRAKTLWNKALDVQHTSVYAYAPRGILPASTTGRKR